MRPFFLRANREPFGEMPVALYREKILLEAEQLIAAIGAGRHHYPQVPCPEGQEKEVEVDDDLSPGNGCKVALGHRSRPTAIPFPKN